MITRETDYALRLLRTLRDGERRTAAEAAEREAAQEQGLRITARVNTGGGVRCRAVADTLPDYVRPAEPTLEDAYLYLISREAEP